MIKKSMKVIQEKMEISTLIKSLLEIDHLKKLLLKEDERNLLLYQFKYLNVGSFTSTNEYLDSLLNKGFKRRIKSEIEENEDLER